MEIRVAGAQMPVTTDIAKNAETILRAIDYAASEKADILLTPEGSLSGYTPNFDPRVVCEALAAITAKARSHSLALALGTCFREQADGQAYNQIRFMDRAGMFLGIHSKILRCGSPEDEPRGEIRDYATTPLRTFSLNGATVGGLICNDLWANPCCTPMPDSHLTQQLSRMGARIIFHAVNGGRNDSDLSRASWHYHESNLVLRALAGRVWIVTVDNSDPSTLPCSAPCGVMRPDGTWALKTAPRGEQFFACTIDLGDANAAVLPQVVKPR